MKSYGFWFVLGSPEFPRVPKETFQHKIRTTHQQPIYIYSCCLILYQRPSPISSCSGKGLLIKYFLYSSYYNHKFVTIHTMRLLGCSSQDDVKRTTLIGHFAKPLEHHYHIINTWTNNFMTKWYVQKYSVFFCLSLGFVFIQLQAWTEQLWPPVMLVTCFNSTHTQALVGFQQ